MTLDGTLELLLLNVAEFILYVGNSGILSQGMLSCNIRVYQVLKSLVKYNSAHYEPMTGQEHQKRFALHLYIFHLYLIINKNAEKGMYLVIQERFSSNI